MTLDEMITLTALQYYGILIFMIVTILMCVIVIIWQQITHNRLTKLEENYRRQIGELYMFNHSIAKREQDNSIWIDAQTGKKVSIPKI